MQNKELNIIQPQFNDDDDDDHHVTACGEEKKSGHWVSFYQVFFFQIVSYRDKRHLNNLIDFLKFILVIWEDLRSGCEGEFIFYSEGQDEDENFFI